MEKSEAYGEGQRWDRFMREHKHTQGHATNCGQIAVMHDLSARPALHRLMQESVTRNGDGTYRVRFFDPKNDQAVSVAVRQPF